MRKLGKQINRELILDGSAATIKVKAKCMSYKVIEDDLVRYSIEQWQLPLSQQLLSMRDSPTRRTRVLLNTVYITGGQQ